MTGVPAPLRWWRSTSLRIAICQSLAIVAATAFVGTGVTREFHATMREQVDQRLIDDLRSLTHHFDSQGRPGLIRAMRRRADIMPDLMRTLYDRDGRRLAGSGATPRVAPGWTDGTIALRDRAAVHLRLRAVALADGTLLVIGSNTDTLAAGDARIIRLFAIQGVAIAALGVASALVLGLYLRRRLAGMSAAAQAIMVGRLDRRMPIRRDDEFDHLARVLNAMLDRIAALVDNLRQVSSDIAHDLRTPLTRLRADIEQAARHGVDHRRLGAIQAQADEVLELFAAMLRISEVEAGRVREGFATVDLSALVLEWCKSYEPAARDGGRALDWTIAPGIGVHGDRQLLAQAFINLIENALLHAPQGSRIAVALTRNDATVTLCIRDDGPGVPAADRARVLQRFTRLEAGRAAPGHGLGLSLVAAIAAAHDATLTLGDAAPGLGVILALPIAANLTFSQ